MMISLVLCTFEVAVSTFVEGVNAEFSIMHSSLFAFRLFGKVKMTVGIF